MISLNNIPNACILKNNNRIQLKTRICEILIYDGTTEK